MLYFFSHPCTLPAVWKLSCSGSLCAVLLLTQTALTVLTPTDSGDVSSLIGCRVSASALCSRLRRPAF